MTSVASFRAGLGQATRLDVGRRVDLTCGLGMSSSGMALVAAGSAFAGLPQAVLPVVAYNLVQHIGAGITDRVQVGRDAAKQ